VRSRRLMWRYPLGTFLVALALLLSSSTGLAQETVTVQINPVDESGVSGTAVLTADGDGTNVTLNITGLAAGAGARATMHANTCAMPSASFAALPDLKADATGKATATGRVLFHGTQDVALTTMADNEHIIAIHADEQWVACGTISKLASGPAPLTLPEAGGVAFWPLAASVGALSLGLCAFSAGLFLWRRRSKVAASGAASRRGKI
jgi:hypothetical protein